MSSKLQNLSSQFNTLLTEYTNTYENYINTLNSTENNLITVPNTSYIGQSNISITNNSSLDSCQTSCISNTNCSGATFNNNSTSCTLSSGSGNIVSTPQSTSIVQQALYYSYQLQLINSQLLNINKEMLAISNNSFNQFQKTQKKNQRQEQILNRNYQTLSQERLDIDKMVREFERLNSAYENGNIIVNSNYYFYIILMFVAISLILLFIKFSVEFRDNNANVTWIPIVIVTFIGIFLVYLLIQQ